MKETLLKEYKLELEKKIQIRLKLVWAARKKGGGEENQGTAEETADKVQGDFAA